MKTIAISALALATAALADEGKWVKFDNAAQKPRSIIKSKRFGVHARDTAPDAVVLSNQDNLYAINLKVGTPQQNISVQIDTGSSDLWFPVTGSSLCNLQTSECDSFGSYSTSSSSTVKQLNQNFQIAYGDGTKIRGTFVTDSVALGDVSLTGVQFAACSSGSSQTGVQGILGIGYETNEASVATTGKIYPNILSSLVSQGHINTQAYSMWLNDPDSAEGNVLFGGVDTAKYTGNLISMPVVPDSSGGYSELSMPLSSISVSAGGKSFNFSPSGWSSPALIDSGTTLMYLPDDVVEAIYTSLGTKIVQQTPLLPCNYGNDNGNKMTFAFNGDNGAKIDVLLQDLLLDVQYRQGGVSYCELLVSGGAPAGLIILGDAFMRSAYIVYDLENNMIAIAQSKFNETSENIKEINSSGIPSASVMSTLVGASAVDPTATQNIPGAGASAFASGSGSSGALETTAPVPTFSITNTAAGASSTSKPSSANGRAQAVSVTSIFGIVAGTVTLLSVFGGAMVAWF